MNHPQDSSAEPKRRQISLRQLTHLLTDLSELEADPEMEVIELQSDEILFQQGDPGDAMYVVLAGALGVRVRKDDGTETEIDRLASGAIVGELALLSGQTRTATVYAMNNAGVLRLTPRAFERILSEDPEALNALDRTAAKRWERIQLVNALGRLFGELDTRAVYSLQETIDWEHYANGDVLFRQGDLADGMYIVVNGRLRVFHSDDEGHEQIIGDIGPGETVGEMAVLTGGVRSASVRAVRNTNLAKISIAAFRRFVNQYPELLSRITEIIVARQQSALLGTSHTAATSLTLAILPASPTVDVQRFAHQLGLAMEAYGSTLILDSMRFDEAYGHEGASQVTKENASHASIVAWMNELDTTYQHVLYLTDPTPTQWTKRCLGQADRILILADPRETPEANEAERLLASFDVPVRCELVLWHPAHTVQPQGTMSWLQNRSVQAHHHVRMDDETHMARMARRLTGRAIALVLSGGGARGFAHLGVYRALEELQIPIDYVGSTSMGAIIGASIMMGWSAAEIQQKSKQFTTSRQLLDYTLPFTSLVASRKVTDLCKTQFGDISIEDLWFPFFCVSSNLSTAEAVIHQTGPLWRAVRTSMAMPGVFTPVMDDGDVLSDGGVMDNFPVGIMVNLCESRNIIGVNVAPYRETKRYYDFDTDVSGWRILWSRINPFAKRIRTPALIGTIMRAQELNSVHRGKEIEAMADLVIKPDVRKFGLLDFTAYEAIAQMGYEAAIEPLREWRTSRLQGQPQANALFELASAS